MNGSTSSHSDGGNGVQQMNVSQTQLPKFFEQRFGCTECLHRCLIFTLNTNASDSNMCHCGHDRYHHAGGIYYRNTVSGAVEPAPLPSPIQPTNTTTRAGSLPTANRRQSSRNAHHNAPSTPIQPVHFGR